MLDCRKNIYSLTPAELSDFIDAVNMLKASGEYDIFVKRHYVVRGRGHRGPAFLPWHRYFIREFELALQAHVPGVTLPYWHWPDDNPDPINGALWNTAPMAGPIYIGGDGTGPGNTITTGPFAAWEVLEPRDPLPGEPNNPLPDNHETLPLADLLDELDDFLEVGPGIRRNLGNGNPANFDPFFPTQAQVDDLIAGFPDYDVAPWNISVNSFRNRLEGFLQVGGEDGNQLHNRGHSWISGSMQPPTSPNDPVFFLHHCNVDRLWALWQRQHPNSDYAPVAGGPNGHNLNDNMLFLTTPGATPAGSLDYAHDMGFMYDTDFPFPTLETAALNFDDTPEGLPAVRPIVFDILDGCEDKTMTFRISGGLPGPFSAPFGNTETYDPATTMDHEVRLYVAYTGTSNGDSHNETITVTVDETEDSFEVDLNGNTVGKLRIACALVLDRSGSMDNDAGLGNGDRRMDVLQGAAPTFVDLLGDEDGIAVASFSSNSTPDMSLGVAGPPSMDPMSVRGQARTAIMGLSPGGRTSIADGIDEGFGLLPADGAYDDEAVVVFTDGHENEPQWLTDIADDIDGRVFAIGMGRPEVLDAGHLGDIVNGSGGYLTMTGQTNIDSGELQKYFVQILSGVKNHQIVLDPSGRILPGNVVSVPFILNGQDYAADAIVLLPRAGLLDIVLKSPTGRFVDRALATSGNPTVQLIEGQRVYAYRMGLPLVVPPGSSHAGQWHLIIKIGKENFEKYLKHVHNDPREAKRASASGVPYSVIVSAQSSLALKGSVKPGMLRPGDTFTITGRLTEYGLPFRGQAKLFAEIRRPDQGEVVAGLAEQEQGVFVADATVDMAGVYTIRLRAEGFASDGRRFTREQLLTVASWNSKDDIDKCCRSRPSVPEEERRRRSRG